VITLLFFSTLYVFLKSSQQIHVIKRRWLLIPIFSFGMSYCDIFLIDMVATHGRSVTVWVTWGMGGTIGCWLGMWFSHPKKEQGIEHLINEMVGVINEHKDSTDSDFRGSEHISAAMDDITAFSRGSDRPTRPSSDDGKGQK